MERSAYDVEALVRLLPSITRLVENTLFEAPAGLSEYQLFRHLAERGLEVFARITFADELNLFRSHFLLFHALYKLRGELLSKRHGILVISCLHIELTAYEPVVSSLPVPEDPLQAYYLDLENLWSTSREDVRLLLNGFWERFFARQNAGGALRCLDLPEDAPPDVIKRRFRQLVWQNHPDRGGDGDRLMRVNAAMTTLKQAGLV